MKKTRNSFFQESNFESYNPNPYGMNQTAPYQSASNYYYQGPMPNNYTTGNMNNDMESRIAKIERQINRMDYRISRLENTSSTITTDEYENNTTNMYML